MSFRTGRPDEHRHQRGGHRDAGRRAVLRDGAGGDVHVHVALGEGLLADVEAGRVAAGVGPRRAGRLLHHVAELAGEHQLALALHHAGLDEHDVAAHRRVVHAGGDADRVLGAGALGVHLGAAQQAVHHLRRDAGRFHFLGRDLPRDLAGQLADLTLELADAGLAGVPGDHLAQRAVADLDLLGREALLLELARDEVVAGDVELLPLGVARKLHRLHPVQQRAGDVLEEVGGADEEHLAQVERHAEVVIGEAVVLRRIEHLEQRARGVALEGDAELVHLVEEEDGVLGAGLLHPLDDAPRHSARRCAGARRCRPRRGRRLGPRVLPPHGAGDGLGHRRLADARRTREGRMGPLRAPSAFCFRGFAASITEASASGASFVTETVLGAGGELALHGGLGVLGLGGRRGLICCAP